MPSQKILVEKQALVAELSQKLQNSTAGVLVDYKGINVANDTKLRKELRDAGVDYFVVKNTMLERVSENIGFEDLKPYLVGTSALALSDADSVIAAKILTKYSESSKGQFSIKAGFVDGAVIDAAKVTELGKLPSKEILLSMLLSALTGNLRGLACALNSIAEKNGEAAPQQESAAPVEVKEEVSAAQEAAPESAEESAPTDAPAQEEAAEAPAAE